MIFLFLFLFYSVIFLLFCLYFLLLFFFFFFQAEDGIRDRDVTGVQTCALPISACRQSCSASSGCRDRAAARVRPTPWHAPTCPARRAPRRHSSSLIHCRARDRKSVV